MHGADFRLFLVSLETDLWESLMDSKMEDVINQSSSYNLKISVDIHSHSTKSKSTAAVKILTASYSNKLINIHDSANPTSLFPHLLCLVLQIDFSQCCYVCRGLFGNRFVASLLTLVLVDLTCRLDLDGFSFVCTCPLVTGSPNLVPGFYQLGLMKIESEADNSAS